MAVPLLDIEGLTVSFRTERGTVTAVNGISLQVESGEVLGIVGESGCGKSVTSQAILRLFDEKNMVKYGGAIRFMGHDLLALTETEMQRIRGRDIAMVFQDPSSSINPVYTIGYQIAETIMMHQRLSKKEALEKAVEMLRLTGIPSPERRVHDYPHEISGGMKQRVMIAMALACEPKLLIADEPTTALDVTIQAQILELMLDINRKLQMGMILITHDLGVVAEACHRVAVMYLGQIVEEGDVHSLFSNPLHPYTQGLMKSIPQIDGRRDADLFVISGTVPSLSEVPQGCRFAPRCEYADDLCRQRNPDLVTDRPGKKVRCWHYRSVDVRQEGVG